MKRYKSKYILLYNKMKYLICPTCGKVLGDIEIEYEIKSNEIMMSMLSEQDKIIKKKELIESMGINRYCCKMRIFTQIDPYKIIR
jgi:DNA-directed RNA polymerase subunit N (RpoN/RPB10)